ncbi:uncharacterized protein LOC113850768 [Abrus precatorius]|uniref:Uncharacterized protein LOC113850768 n=1 Tax=Abrus precatorius TaxID=3816 RepID=A0A8B8K270_ABRPR|nr:uncharacterized protein LOC113850768 [Abrus precatorius]
MSEKALIVNVTYLLCGKAEDWWRFAGQILSQEDLPTLVSKSKIFEANSRRKIVDTRGARAVRQERRPLRFSKGLYSGSSHSYSRGTSFQERSSGTGSGSGSSSGTGSFRGPLKCFMCGGPHMVKDCLQPWTTYNNCEKSGHTANVCWAAKRSDSLSTTQRPESRGSTGLSTGPKPSIPGRVFAMSEAEATQLEELIRDKCIIKGRLLDVLFDLGAMHLFVYVDCVNSLNLYMIELSCNVVVTTHTDKPVVTSWVCLGCLIMVHGKEFEVDLICLPLSQLDVILGMD